MADNDKHGRRAECDELARKRHPLHVVSLTELNARKCCKMPRIGIEPMTLALLAPRSNQLS
eukprot:355317-Chlamydomonas_euryale.AAC.1